MNARVSLRNLSQDYYEETEVNDIEDRNCFNYTDRQGIQCEICVYEQGLCLFRHTNEYLIELHLLDKQYAKITSAEGIVRFDVKVLDFRSNSDILIMHYLIDDEERIIEIKYY